MRFSALIALSAVSLVSCGQASSDTADLTFAGACDGSAAAMVSGDHVAIADDESATLRIYPLGGGKGASRDVGVHLGASASNNFEPDIEAAARVGTRVYWTASHGHNGDGEQRPERRVFFATSADERSAPVGRARHDLLRGMIGDPALSSLRLSELDEAAISPEGGGINVEAMAAGTRPNQLLIGLRSPQSNGSAIVIPLENAAQIIDTDAAPRFGAPMFLDLGGLGLRDMVRRSNGSYVLIAGPTDDSERFALFAWNGPQGPAPTRLATVLAGLRPEAVVESNGRLVLFSDDGDKRDPRADKKCKKLKDPAMRHFAGRRV